ncbi:hypothetical protein ES703_09496 [subsurface metagenome]
MVWLGLAQRGRIRQRQGLRQRQSLFFLPFLSLAAKTVVGNALWRSVWSEHPFYGIWLPILRARPLPHGALLPDPERVPLMVSL